METLRTSQSQIGFKVAKCYAWWCQGIKRLFRKPKHTKERTKLDSNRGVCRTIPNLMNLSHSWCSKLFSAWSSQYDKQVKIPRLRVRKFVTYDIRYSNGKLNEYVIIRIRTNHHRLHILISYFKLEIWVNWYEIQCHAYFLVLPDVSLLTFFPGEMDEVDEWVAMLTEGEVVGSTSNSSIVLKVFTR